MNTSSSVKMLNIMPLSLKGVAVFKNIHMFQEIRMNVLTSFFKTKQERSRKHDSKIELLSKFIGIFYSTKRTV